jgi:hypothetical protein
VAHTNFSSYVPAGSSYTSGRESVDGTSSCRATTATRTRPTGRRPRATAGTRGTAAISRAATASSTSRVPPARFPLAAATGPWPTGWWTLSPPAVCGRGATTASCMPAGAPSAATTGWTTPRTRPGAGTTMTTAATYLAECSPPTRHTWSRRPSRAKGRSASPTPATPTGRSANPDPGQGWLAPVHPWTRC